MTQPPMSVVLSTDCGTEMDDQWALALLALSPAFDLRAVVGAHAANLAAPAVETAARLHAAGVVVRDVPGTGWLRASCGWWTSEDDIELYLNAL